DQLRLWLRGSLLPADGAAVREVLSYAEAVEGFGTVRIDEADPARDLDLIHEWVTAERAVYWGMQSLSREAIILLDSVPTHHVYVVRLDGVPVAVLQTYDPQADPAGAA